MARVIPQWIVERDRLERHLACVSEMHQRVTLGEMDPEQPTHFKRGGWDRIVLMTVRSDLGLPLFVDGDCDDDEEERPDLSNRPRPEVQRCKLVLQDSLERLTGGRVFVDSDANSSSHDH